MVDGGFNSLLLSPFATTDAYEKFLLFHFLIMKGNIMVSEGFEITVNTSNNDTSSYFTSPITLDHDTFVLTNLFDMEPNYTHLEIPSNINVKVIAILNQEEKKP